MHRLLLAVSIALLVPLAAAAQQPTTAYISVKEVEVRSGPSNMFPPTGKLLLNDRVTIKRDANSGEAWEIVPPSGSFSWVCAKDVQAGTSENGRQILSVVVDETQLRMGAAGSNQPLISVSIKVKRGTKLVARGEAVHVAIEKESWWPVDCVPEESRFIPKSAVQASAVARDLPPLPSPGGAGTKDSPQWLTADQAHREGRLDDAERLFANIMRENEGSGKDWELYLRAHNRLTEIRMQRRSTLTSRPSGGNSPFIPPQTGIAPLTARNDQLPPRPRLPATGREMGRPASATPNGRWEASASGWLRRSGFQIDGKQTYALETANGELRAYVTADAGVDLEAHLNRRPVELFGTFEIRGDVRGANHLRAARVVPLR